ncbi:MAG: hypothetical protein EAZ55_08685 [Cytophagales bacterium]|nr:MAG: hypothetical protein EAZ55_08685 [Cytophagales bacterium]
MKTHYSKLIILIISLFLNLGIVSCNSDSAASTNKAPITIYYGGDIITMEGDKPNYAEAIAIQGDKIIFVGSKEDAQKYEDKTTQWIDLKGKTLLPGFIDPHLHPVIAATILPLEIVSANRLYTAY